MQQRSHELNPDPPAFTYLKDQYDHIYYASGLDRLDDKAMRVVLVYVPAPLDEARRLQVSTGIGYSKVIAHGYQAELPRIQQQLSARSYRMIRNMMERDPYTNDEFLLLPTENVTEIYDPKASLDALLRGETPGFSKLAVQKLSIAVDMFARNSIAQAGLGLYGSLQCHLRDSRSGDINDIDMLVDGCDSYTKIVGLAAGNLVRPETFPDFVATDAVKRAVAIRRGQLSQFRLPNHPDTVVDIRLLHTGHNWSLPRIGETRPQDITCEDALIVEASESLSIPARYVVRNSQGQDLSIVTTQYHHLGAAGIGDSVSFKGIPADEHTVMLSDPERHYIHTQI